METLNREYTRVNEVMDWREKYVFGICKKIIESGTSKYGGFKVDEHATYILDLAYVIEENTEERFLLANFRIKQRLVF